jgi:hypothetical protein
MTTHRTTVRPSTDETWWLHEYQKVMTNVHGLITRGQSESATRLIDELVSRWQRGCRMNNSDNISGSVRNIPDG